MKEAEKPRVVARRIAYSGAYLGLRVDDVVMPDGSMVVREVVDHPGAVVIAALDKAGRVALARQYRHAVEDDLLELPAGVIDTGEQPSVAAARELREEAGVACARLDSLGSFFSSPGFLHEELHAFLARELAHVGTDPDDDEDIEIEWHDLAGLLGEPGRLRDAKTLAALLLVDAFLRREETSGA